MGSYSGWQGYRGFQRWQGCSDKGLIVIFNHVNVYLNILDDF